MSQAYEARGRRNGSGRGAVKSRANDVLEDFTELKKDMAKLADAVGKAARGEVNHAGERLSSLSETLRERATEISEDLRERANEGVGYVGDKVRERPFAAVGISLGVGVLLGLALSRR